MYGDASIGALLVAIACMIGVAVLQQQELDKFKRQQQETTDLLVSAGLHDQADD